MSKPIYQIFVGNNNIAANLAWKALSEAERKKLTDQEQASREAVGAKAIVLCDSAWADEAHPWWGLLRFPSLQARLEHTRTLQKIGWLDITDAFTLLGTSEAEPEAVTVPNPIYKLWIIKNNPATAMTGNLPKGLDALRWEKHNALYKQHHSQVILSCGTAWCNEAYMAFGISVYPDVEANMNIMAGLNEMGWPGYFECISYLGISSMG
jgi:hypothetical protein